ncbi:MAG: HD domain-containing protein [Candidatus Hodarchaeales archaeon]
MERNLVSQAFDFAYRVHSRTTRKGTTIPYITHPLNVMIILLRNNASEELLAAALLHDVVEDEEVTFQELTEIFGKKVCNLVREVSEPLALIEKSMNRTETWRTRKEHTINSLQKATYEVKMLSCADKLANVSDMLQDQNTIGEKLWSKFNASKLNQQWYYDSLVEVFAQEPHSLSELLYYQEFKEKVQALFH